MNRIKETNLLNLFNQISAIIKRKLFARRVNLSKPLFVALFSVLLLTAVNQVQSQTLKADYQFQGDLNSSVGGVPAMTNLTGSGANSFQTDTVDGYTRQTVRFPFDSGLGFINNGAIPNNAYTAVILFRFDEVSGFRRVFDATNGTLDNCGAYILNGRYENEPTNTSPTIQPNTYFQAVIVREASGRVRAYRDGVLRVDFPNDDGCFQISNTFLRFFQDDNQFGDEASAGNVARIRLYDAPMTTAQVQALDRVPMSGITTDSKIAVTSFRDGDGEIYVMNTDGSNQIRLTFIAGSDNTPTWSPDGQKLAFDSNRSGNFQVYVMNADGSNTVRLTNSAFSDGFPDWSPDGTKIVFNRCGGAGGCEVWTMNSSDGGNQVNITNTAGDDLFAAWSPDNSKIAFTSSRAGNFEIYTMNPDGTNLTRLTNNSAADQQPTWSPDSQKIAFISNRTGNDEIFIMNADGSNQTNISNNPAYESKPSFSPDGTKIVFETGRNGGTNAGEIYTMNIDGSNQTRLTANSAHEFRPDWKPQATTTNCTPIPISIGQSINGSLSLQNSCNINGNPTDVYSFAGTQGQQIAISLDSAASEAFRTPLLQLVAPDGQILDTRSGGFLGVNARIPNSGFFTLPATGTYIIRASSLFNPPRPEILSPLSPQNLGNYTLSLSQRPANPNSCTVYTPSPAITSVAPAGGTFFFDVLSDIGCPNVLASVGANSSHIRIISNIAGRVTFSVTSHGGTADRPGTITVGGQAHTIRQFGVAPPSNDAFAQFQTLQSFNTCVNPPPSDPATVVCTVEGRNTNATAQPGEPTHANSGASKSVWYQWTAPENGLFSFTTSGSTFDTVLAIYTGASVGNLMRIAENDDTTSFDPTSKINFRATAGTVYYIAVDGKNGDGGSIKLSYSRYRRLYRLYLQNFNGLASPIVPSSVKAKRQDNTGPEINGKLISLGVYEFDLPDDNSPYVVTISGPDGITWQPSTYLIDNTAGRFSELMDGAQGGGQNQQSNATFTIPVRFKGFIDNITTQEMSSVNVHIASPGNSAAVAPANCINPPAPALPSPLVPFPNNRVRYDCQVQPNSTHTIIPLAPGKLFTASNLPINTNNNDTSASTNPAFIMTASNATTFNISGQVLANGQGLDNVKIDLSGGSTAQKTSSGGGNYSFENLAPGDYTLTTSRSGFVFQNETVNLQSASVMRNITAQTCAYSFTGDNNFTAGGNPGKLNVKATVSQRCEWTAQSDSDWITMNSNAFIGDGSVPFTVKPNNGLTRQGKIRVGEHDFTVTQANGCTFNVNLTGATTYPATGGTGGSFAITSSNGNCAFTAESTDYCMVSLGRNNNGTINYEISKNSGVARSAVITIAGQSFTVNQAAAPGLHRAKFDFDGDGKADIAVFRPSNGVWYLLRSTEGFTGMQFGAPEDIPVAADYDGDGITDIAVYRPSNGTWYLQRSRDGFTGMQFGAAEDKPVPADYDGDGKTDIAVYRPSNGVWYVFNLATKQFTFAQFGAATDLPVVGDYDGDKKADFAVFRPSNGFWYIAKASGTPSQNFDSIQLGQMGDKPVPADYDGDGKTDAAVYRPSNGTWYLQRSRDGFTGVQFGDSADKPVAADYNGDSFADIAVFRPSTGQWFVWTCSDNRTNTPQLGGVQFGESTDKTVQNPE